MTDKEIAEVRKEFEDPEYMKKATEVVAERILDIMLPPKENEEVCDVR